MRFVGKIIILTFKDTEEKAVERAIAALADMIPLETIQPPHSPALIFPGLEIRLHQRRVLKDGADISLTRLEYGALCYLAASPGRVFTRAEKGLDFGAMNVDSPLNAKRAGVKALCAIKGDRCYDCKSHGRICSGLPSCGASRWQVNLR